MDENVVYRENAAQGKEDHSLLEQTTVLLKEILSSSWGQVKAEWDGTEDGRGRPVYTLKLRDATGEAEARFSLEELRGPLHMRVRLYRLWGDLLRTRNEVQMQQLHEAASMED